MFHILKLRNDCYSSGFIPAETKLTAASGIINLCLANDSLESSAVRHKIVTFNNAFISLHFYQRAGAVTVFHERELELNWETKE